MLNYQGMEFLDDPRLSVFHRAYIRMFGVPISGLRIRLRRILPHIQGDFSSIVDLGCGKGIFTFELAKKFPNARVVGVDTDEEQVRINREIAKKRGIKNVEFEVQDILKMNYDRAFDLAVSIDNLEHIEDDQLALNTIFKCLKPGGKLVCHVPAYERIWRFMGVSTNFDVPGHVRPGYRPEELKEKVQGAGFKLDELRLTYGYLETVSNNLSYMITGADQKNQLLYAVAFPVLNLMAWAGKDQEPGRHGAGVLVRAIRSV